MKIKLSPVCFLHQFLIRFLLTISSNTRILRRFIKSSEIVEDFIRILEELLKNIKNFQVGEIDNCPASLLVGNC